MCSKFFSLRHSLRQTSTYSIFCLAITTIGDAVKTNFGSAPFFCFLLVTFWKEISWYVLSLMMNYFVTFWLQSLQLSLSLLTLV